LKKKQSAVNDLLRKAYTFSYFFALARLGDVGAGARRLSLATPMDTISMLYGIMSYFAKLTGEDLSRYVSKTESVGLRKAYSASTKWAI